MHAHDPGAIDMCLDCGADTIEHASHIRPDQIERLRSGAIGGSAESLLLDRIGDSIDPYLDAVCG